MLVYQQLSLIFSIRKLDMWYAFVNYFRNPFPFMRSVFSWYVIFVLGKKKLAMFAGVFNMLTCCNVTEICSITKILSKVSCNFM